MDQWNNVQRNSELNRLGQNWRINIGKIYLHHSYKATI